MGATARRVSSRDRVNLQSRIPSAFCVTPSITEAAVHALFNDLFEDESGVTAIEYGLIAAFIAVVCVAAWTAIGNNLDSAFTNLESSM